jgi:type II secretory pathway pseudopilin PulG
MLLMNRRGYTIDQTILIVAIIAILITLVIVTLGWTLLSRTSGSKLGSFTDQLTQAINVYYGSHGQLPAALSDLNTDNLIKFRNDGTTFYHDIGGATGTVALGTQTGINETTFKIGTATSASYLVVTFTDVPVSEANEALKSVNGDVTKAGHMVALSSATGSCTQATMSGKVATASTAKGIVCFIAQRVS